MTCAIDFADLVEHALDAVIVIDAAGRIRYANPAAHALTGHPPGGLAGQDVSLLLPADDPLRLVARLRDYLRHGGAPVLLDHTRELALRRQDGRTVEAEMRAFELRPAGGTRLFAGILRDIAERKRLEAERDRMVRDLRELALRDSLTGLPNRRAFLDMLAQQAAAAARRQRPLTLAMIDLDRFKRVNDEHGHAAGDAVLRQTASIVRRALRRSDIVGRIGGEEFCVLLPDTGPEAAAAVLERVRRRVAAAPLPLPAGGAVAVTVSIGVAAMPPGGSADAALAAADRALYRAKEEGRNRVAVAAA